MKKLVMALALAGVAVECGAATPLSVTETKVVTFAGGSSYQINAPNSPPRTSVAVKNGTAAFSSFSPAQGIITGGTLSVSSAPDSGLVTTIIWQSGQIPANTVMTSTTQAKLAVNSSALAGGGMTNLAPNLSVSCTGPCDFPGDYRDWTVSMSGALSQSGLAALASGSAQSFQLVSSQRPISRGLDRTPPPTPR